MDKTWLSVISRARASVPLIKSAMKNRIRNFRLKLNLTQEELANRVQVRRETIVFLEQGKYMPSLKLARDVAQVFSVPIEKIFIFDR